MRGLPALLGVMILANLLVAADADRVWQGTLVVELTFAGPGASGDREAELDRFAGALEERLATMRERLRAADGVTARVLRRDVGQLEGELEAIALDRGASVTLSRQPYVVRGNRLAVDADEGRLLVDRVANTGFLQRGSERLPVKLAPLPTAAEPADTQAGPNAFGQATRQATIVLGGESASVTWIPGWPNIYALERLDAQSRSPLHRAVASLPGMPVDIIAEHKGGRMRWRVVTCIPGPVDGRQLGDAP